MTPHILKAIFAPLLLIISVSIEATTVDMPPPTKNFNLRTLQNNQTYRGILINYRVGSSMRGHASSVEANVDAAAGHASLSAAIALHAHYVRQLATGAELVHMNRDLSASETEALIRQIAADPAVKYVEPEYLMKLDDISLPVDLDLGFPRYQWDYLQANGAGFLDDSLRTSVPDWGGAEIQHAWQLSNGAGITIASLDTGVTVHPDLDLSLANAGYDFISSADISGRPADGRIPGGWDTGDWETAGECGEGAAAKNSSWHGTHVFGTVGGELTNNILGLSGTAYGAQVVPIRVVGHCGGSNADIADAIVWASGGSVPGVPANRHPAQVLSLSLGGQGTCDPDGALGQAISAALGRGAVVVVAAGNANVDVSTVEPANCSGVVSVAAVGISSQRAFYSDYGAVTLAAPGGDRTSPTSGFIWSAFNSGTTVPGTPSYHGSVGTSQATPHVAGIVAMMQSYRLILRKQLLTPAKVIALLQSTATPPNVTPDKPIGAGIVNGYRAVQAAGSQP
ncbi:S8 family serine peptidase [Paraburkholderia rhizosphaerae]|uniref:Serine protease n=1 Tax=Paraburkholderia rhizosphaerae TaxID=480658 RepID=A0A4R8LT12_9BURK|nr:S8 family serine peptidase [Paraburkholderia rhizosphaerae]TDY49915.1 serine protease [Paraburkholderia rhizosphaerae]